MQCTGLIQKFNGLNKLYLIVGLMKSQLDLETNLVPFDCRIYDFNQFKAPKKNVQVEEIQKIDQVTLKIPNNFLPNNNP